MELGLCFVSSPLRFYCLDPHQLRALDKCLSEVRFDRNIRFVSTYERDQHRHHEEHPGYLKTRTPRKIPLVAETRGTQEQADLWPSRRMASGWGQVCMFIHLAISRLEKKWVLMTSRPRAYGTQPTLKRIILQKKREREPRKHKA